MRQLLMIGLATAALGNAAAPANAAATIQQCLSGASCVSGTTNVNLLAYPSTGSPIVQGTVGNGAGAPVVNFTTTNGNGLLDTNPGAATVFRASTNPGSLSQLTFTLLTGSFTAAEFNLERGVINGNTPLTVTLAVLGGGSQTLTVDKPNGSNIFNIIANGTESYTSVSFSSNGAFDDLKQLRLVLAAPTAPVPEPATWAMMLLGFGGIGVTMRHRRRNASLMQIA